MSSRVAVARQAIEEDYLFIMETDHLMLQPVPNTATPTQPIGFGFYYMTHRYDSKKLYPAVKKYFDPDKLDPVAPSPMIIQKDCLKRLVPPWWQLTLRMKRDPPTDAALGWVSNQNALEPSARVQGHPRSLEA